MMQGIMLILLQPIFISPSVISLCGMLLKFLLEPMLEAATIDAYAISIILLRIDFLFHLYRIQYQSMLSLSYVPTFILATMQTAEKREKMAMNHCSK